MNENRWKQRFENFGKALLLLNEALAISKPGMIEKAGLIQCFEMSYELAWNTMKDYLEAQGYTEVKSPRAAIKQAFQIGLITDGHTWIQMLEDRNLTSHAYDEETANAIETLVRDKYGEALSGLFSILQSKIHQ